MTNDELKSINNIIKEALNDIENQRLYYEKLKKIGRYEGHPADIYRNEAIYKYLLFKIDEDLKREKELLESELKKLEEKF